MKVYAVVSEPGCRYITFEVLVQELLGAKNCMIISSTYILDEIINPKNLDKQVVFINCNDYKEISQLRETLNLSSIFISHHPLASTQYDICLWEMYTPRDITLSAMNFLEKENLKQYNDPCMVDLFGEIKNPVD